MNKINFETDPWYVVVDEKNIDILREWFGSNCLSIGDTVGKSKWWNDPPKKGYNSKYVTESKYYTFGQEISFADFKRYILKEQEDVKGYISPTDLFNGELKKGTKFKKCQSRLGFYVPNSCLYHKAPIEYVLPKEIVETWEPYFEETIKVGGYEAKFDKNFVTFGCRIIDKEQIKSVIDIMYLAKQLGKFTIDSNGETLYCDGNNKFSITKELLERIYRKL